jgi:hypothetical protein
MTVAIYSAVFGAYDGIKDVVAQDVDCDLYYFTDQKADRKTNWNVVHLDSVEDLDPRVRSRWFKLMSHRVFPFGRFDRQFVNQTDINPNKQYDTVIWIDGSFGVESISFARDVEKLLYGSDILLFPHYLRKCIFEEAETLASIPKFQHLPVKEQVRRYEDLGFPRGGGLFETGVMARSTPQSLRSIQLNELWWSEIQRWTYRDQLSLPVSLKKSGATPISVPYTVYDNPWLKYHYHDKDT